VERWARIETFVPEDFWFLEMMIRLNEDGSTVPGVVMNDSGGGGGGGAQRQRAQQQGRAINLSWRRGRLYDRVLTMALYESCLEAQEAVVTSMTGRPKNKWRPVPLATVELQKRASRYLRIGSESVMTAAEELYNQGYISYPRTETEKFRPEFEHLPLIQSFTGVAGVFGEYATKLLSNNNFQNPRLGQNDDNAHPPITPCKAVEPSTISDQTQRGIYTLVVKHYLACCSRDALGKETQLTLKIASEDFTAKGLMILEKNWLEIYAPWERWSTGQGELPRAEVGSRITPTALLMKDGRTTAPTPISEVELISLMDRNGIGTDATIAQHITTIQERAYVTKDAQQKFLPTKLGIALVEGYNSMGYQLNKPDLRREMEFECNLVASGQKTKGQIIAPILAKMQECFNRANAEVHKLDEAVARHFDRLGSNDTNSTVLQGNFSECGVCQSRMTLKQLTPGDHNAGNNQRRGNQSNRGGVVRRKILFCSTCSLGLPLPRGELSPMADPQAANRPFLCPICNYQVIKISRGEGYTGNGYQVCPKCFSDPPSEHGGSLAGDFQCFVCTHATCSLAGGTRGGDVEVYPCPYCQAGGGEAGKVNLRKTSRGYVLSCNATTAGARCTYALWLPKESRSVSVGTDPNSTGEQTEGGGQEEMASLCRRCSSGDKTVRKLKFVWKPGSVPPHYGREYVGCVLCDDMLRSDMGIRLPPPPNQVRTRQPNRQGRVQGGRGRGRGRGAAAANRVASRPRGNTGGTSCYKCGQTGHFANSCPNN